MINYISSIPNHFIVHIHYDDHIKTMQGYTALEYMDALCQKQMSTLKVRKKAFAQFIRIRKYVPVYIHSELLLMPADAYWINYFSIKAIHTSYIELKNGERLNIEHPKRIEDTFTYCHRFLSIIKNAAD